MTKADEIIQTIGALTKHYGKKISTYWLPWIPTVGLTILFSMIAAEQSTEIGQTRTITIDGWAPIGTMLLFIVPWAAGYFIGEIPRKKKDENNDK